MKTAINCLLILQVVFIFSATRTHHTTANHSQVGSPPVITHKVEEKAIVNIPKIERIPFRGCSDVYSLFIGLGLSTSEATAATEIVRKESTCRPYVINTSSGSCGLVQALPCSKLALNGDIRTVAPVDQLRWMQRYVKVRYGNFYNALDHQKANGWY